MAGGDDQGLEPLQRQREVGSTLGWRESVHLVDDHVLDASQYFPSLAGEQQVEALGGRDQDLGRILGERSASVGRGITGSGRDPHLGQVHGRALRGSPNPGQGRP